MLNFIIFSKIYLSVNCPVGEPAVGELGIGKLGVGELGVGELGVGELSVGEPTRTSSDLEDEFTPEVDDQGQIWWFVDSLVEKKMRYCKESKRRRWFYRTRFVGHGPDKDCWLTSDQLDCTDLVRGMHGLEPLAPA